MTVDVYKRHELPNYWEWKKLGEICSVTDRDHRTPKYIENGIPLISPRDFTENGIDLSRLKSVDKSEHVEFVKKCNPAKGDILYSRIGTIGEARLQNFDFDFVALHSIALIKPTLEGLDPKYVLYLLQTPDVRSQAKHNIKSVGTPDLGLKRINNFDVPLAPLGEQQRIVAEIEKQFSRLDEAVANLKRVKANLKRYKASVLKAAVEGKLTEDWRKQHPNVEPASKLLERILAERRKKWSGRGKYKEPSPDTNNLPSLSKGWIWTPLEAISEATGGFAFESKKFTSTGFQVLKMANIRMGRIDVSQKPSFIQDVGVDVVAKYGLMDGDLVVTLTGTRKKQDYGYVAVVRNTKGLLLNQRIARLRPADGVLPQFLALALQSEDYRNRFFAYETGNVGQGNVGMGAVTKTPITLAPFAEQEQIVTEVERHLSVIEGLEATIEANLTRADRLRQSTLAAAFSGRLLSGQD